MSRGELLIGQLKIPLLVRIVFIALCLLIIYPCVTLMVNRVPHLLVQWLKFTPHIGFIAYIITYLLTLMVCMAGLYLAFYLSRGLQRAMARFSPDYRVCTVTFTEFFDAILATNSMLPIVLLWITALIFFSFIIVHFLCW